MSVEHSAHFAFGIREFTNPQALNVGPRPRIHGLEYEARGRLAAGIRCRGRAGLLVAGGRRRSCGEYTIGNRDI